MNYMSGSTTVCVGYRFGRSKCIQFLNHEEYKELPDGELVTFFQKLNLILMKKYARM